MIYNIIHIMMTACAAAYWATVVRGAIFELLSEGTSLENILTDKPGWKK